MAKLLVAAFDISAHVRLGDIVEVYPDSYEWGGKEGLPKFIRAVITDRTDDQVRGYLQDVKRVFTYTIDVQNAQGVRATVSVDADFSGNFDPSVRQNVKNYILLGGSDALPVTQHGQTANSLTVDIALPNDATRIPKLQKFRDDINDKFADVIEYRRYHFSAAAVATVIAAGGTWTGTTAQVVNNIVDRFA